MTTDSIKSIPEFMKKLDDDYKHRYGGLLYRGVSNSKYELIPSLGRDVNGLETKLKKLSPKNVKLVIKKFSEIEKKLGYSLPTVKKSQLSSFKNDLSGLLDLLESCKAGFNDLFYSAFERFRLEYRSYDNNIILNSDIDILVAMQHHSCPTPLLDWSYSPLVALYFALQSPPISVNAETTDAAIYVLDDHLSEDGWGNSNDFEDFSRLKKDLFHGDGIKIISHTHVSPRVTAQSGAFTFHQNCSNALSFSEKGSSEGSISIKKYILDKNSLFTMKQELNRLRIVDNFIFPDLDGLCKSLKEQILSGADILVEAFKDIP